MIRDITVFGYLAAVISMIMLEVAARQPGSTLPTAADCVGWLMRHPAGRVVMLLSWWWVGWHFLAR